MNLYVFVAFYLNETYSIGNVEAVDEDAARRGLMVLFESQKASVVMLDIRAVKQTVLMVTKPIAYP